MPKVKELTMPGGEACPLPETPRKAGTGADRDAGMLSLAAVQGKKQAETPLTASAPLSPSAAEPGKDDAGPTARQQTSEEFTFLRMDGGEAR